MILSEKITHEGKILWAAVSDLSSSRIREFRVYEDKDLKIPHKDMWIRKLDLKEAIATSVNEAGGAGFAVWGGGSGRNFGNPSMGRSFYGRGFGFGSSNTGSGMDSMYTYDVKPLNQTLEPHNYSSPSDERQIHVGSVVKGKILGKDKHIIGQIQQVKQDETGDILYYLVRDPDTAKAYKVDPTATFIWEPENEGPSAASADIPSAAGSGGNGNGPTKMVRPGPTRESYYPRLQDYLNEMDFKRGEEPYDALGIGNENDIYTFLESLNKNDIKITINIAEKFLQFIDNDTIGDIVIVWLDSQGEYVDHINDIFGENSYFIINDILIKLYEAKIINIENIYDTDEPDNWNSEYVEDIDAYIAQNKNGRNAYIVETGLLDYGVLFTNKKLNAPDYEA